MELGEFMMLSSEMKNKEILLSVLLIIQFGVTILWHCPFLLQIKSMMELGESIMLSSEMKNNLVTLSLSAADLKHDGTEWIHDALLGNEGQGDPPLCAPPHPTGRGFHKGK